MKHVWILNHYAPHPDAAGGMRHYNLGRFLREHGWKATIIAASTEIDRGRQQRLEREGVTFIWLPARAYAGNGIGRVLNMTDYTRAVLNPASLAPIDLPDAVIGSSVHPLAAWAGRRLARRYGVPFLFEVRDLWPQTLIDMGRLSNAHPAATALRALEKSLYRSAARIIVLLPKAHEYIEALGIDGRKVVWIPNGVDPERFPWHPVQHDPQSFRLMYFGAHGEANGLDNLLMAMGKIKSAPDGRSISLRLIGEGPLKQELIDKARQLELENVKFEEPVSRSQLPAIAAQADAFMFNLIDAPVFRFGISSNKLFDFLAARRPIIFCSAASNNVVETAGAGITVPPEDSEALAEAIIRMAALPVEDRERMGAAGRAFLEANHNIKLLASRLAETLNECEQR